MKKVKQNVQSVSEDEEFYTSWNGNHKKETSKIKVVRLFHQFFLLHHPADVQSEERIKNNI